MHRPTQGPSAQRWSNGGGAWWGGSKATGAATACHTHQADRLVSGSCADGWAKKPAPLPSPTYLPANLNQPPPPPTSPAHPMQPPARTPPQNNAPARESRRPLRRHHTRAGPPPLPPRGQGGVRDRRDRRGGGRPYAPVERPIINGALGGEVPRVVEGGGGDHGGGGEGVEVRKRTGAV